MNGFWIALTLCVVSAFCYGGGAVVQRRLARQFDNGPLAARAATFGALLEHRLWWSAVGLNTAGALLHVAALYYGALIVVQPLGTLALVFALPWSAWLAVRQVTPREWHGAALTAVGLSIMLLTTAPSGTDDRLDPAETLVVLAATAAVLGACAWSARRLRHPWRGLTLAGAAGVAFGVASALAKTLSADLPANGIAGVTDTRVLGLLALALAGMLLSQAAYRGMDVGAPLAAMSLANPAAAIVTGVCFMGEQYAAGPWGIGVSALAGMVAVRGVVLLAVPKARRVPHAPADRTTPVRY